MMKPRLALPTSLAAAVTSALFACSNPPPGPDYGDTMTAGSGGTSASAGGVPGGSGNPGVGGSSGGVLGTGGVAGGSTGGTQSGGGSGGSAVPGVMGHPDPNIAYPTYPGFTLTLAEEFNEPLDLVGDPVWTYSDGGLPEGNVRFVKEAISFGDGLMRITCSQNPMGQSSSYAENGSVAGKPLRSGELRTKYNNFRYGRYEARLKAPNPAGDTAPQLNGNFIHTLFVFRTPKTEQWREIDIEVTGDRPSALTTNVLYGDNRQGWSADIQEAASGLAPQGFDSRADFHVYAFEWTPTEIRWYIDGQPIRTKGAGGLPIPEQSAKIMMNLWIFPNDGFGGDPTNNVYPMVAEYDYFRFYKLDSEPKYPCAGPPACLDPSDVNLSKNNPEDGVPP